MAVLDRVPTARITARAAQINLGALLLSLLALPFIALGYTAFWVWVGVKAVLTGLGVATRWVSAAVLVGFEMGRERRAR